jgi:putative ABC transport system permease protein
VARSSIFRKIAIVGEKYIYSDVKTIDYNYFKFNNLNIVEGKGFDIKSSGNLCIVGQKYFRDNINSKGIGEIVNLAGHNYKVIGVASDARFNECIIIPTASAENLNLLSNNMTCYVKFKNEVNIRFEANELKKYIVSNFENNFEIKVFGDVYKEKVNTSIRSTLAMFGIVMLVLCYSLLNIANIILNKVNENRKNYGVRIALGATNQDIYLQNFFNLLIQLIIASVIVFIAIYIIGEFTNSIIGFVIIKLNFIVIIISVFMGIFISSIMSFLTLKKVMKLNVVEILRG